MAQDAKQQHSAPMSIIEGRSKSDRMRHGSTEALAMLRASSATSDTLTATFDGYDDRDGVDGAVSGLPWWVAV